MSNTVNKPEFSTFSTGFSPNSEVVANRVWKYSVENVENAIRFQLKKLGCSDMFKDKRVAIKPNLVMKKSPEAAATTHPIVLEAMLRILKESAADIVIAESPPGVYTESALKGFYNACGITEVAERYSVRLNFDTSSREVSIPYAKSAHMFELITPMLDADVIVNLAKLKSHALTKFSGTVKNYFGTVPGITKIETHARFPDYGDFASMLVDLCSYFAFSKPTFNILDGILAMEGNGPTGGDARELGWLLSGLNPYNVDIVGAKLIGFDDIMMLNEAIKRGYAVSEPLVYGDPLEIVENFKLPDTSGSTSALEWLSKAFGGRLYKWLQPRPEVSTNMCISCGECVRSCPQKTIRIVEGKKRHALIDDSGCIKCYCCQEMCPVKAVRIKKNPIMKLLGG